MKEARRNSGKKASSKSSLGMRAFSIEKKDNNAHVGKTKKERTMVSVRIFYDFFFCC